MSEKGRQVELMEQTQQLLRGSLKHVRRAALAAVLVPLAVVTISAAVVTQSSSGGSSSGGTGGAATVPAPCDFTTSGGFVLMDSGKEANFGAHGGCKSDGFWGHLNYVDHASGYHVDSLTVTGYLTPTPGSNIREVCGTATTNNPADAQPVLFRIRLIDNGEPGTGDQFGIRLSNGYLVSTRLLNAGLHGGGNVQLHGANPSTVGPNPSPDEAAMCGGVQAP
jgi:hypothetical protein